MTRIEFVGALSYHAQDRVFQRTRLTPIEVQRILDRREYCWAEVERDSDARYAVVFDVVSKGYVVAVVCRENRVVKTVLTLEQFEFSAFPISDTVKLLARLAILPKSALPEVGLTVKGAGVADLDNGYLWRFMVKDCHRTLFRLSPLTQQQVGEMAGKFPVALRKKVMFREGRRVVATAAFLSWVAEQLGERNIDPGTLKELWLEALSPVSFKCAFGINLTDWFVSALQSSCVEYLES